MRKRQEIRQLERTIRNLHNVDIVVGHDPPEKEYVHNLYNELQDKYKEMTGHFYSWRENIGLNPRSSKYNKPSKS